MFCPKCGKEATENATFCAGCGASLTGGQPARKTRFSTAAGIVEIVAGGCTAVFAIIVLIIGELPAWFVLFPIAMAITSTLAIIGGICALRRKNRAMALTGAIAVVGPSSILGIAAVVLNIMARDEFERQPAPR
jgi:hypothetical protein